MNNKGQTILSEYVMIFFVVIAAAVAMTVFVQRGIEGRVHDARNSMINAIVSSGACDADCVQAAGGNIRYEYEPYYTQALSDVSQNQTDNRGARPGNPQVLGAAYFNSTNEETATTTFSCQFPPACANFTSGTLPCYCTCPSTCTTELPTPGPGSPGGPVLK
jgi:hypothetical protein